MILHLNHRLVIEPRIIAELAPNSVTMSELKD